MTDDEAEVLGGNPRSTARIGGHPLHPMLIPFPIVCFVGALVTDILFAMNGEPGWATASNWLLGFGLGFAALAAVAGLTDYMGDSRVRSLGAATRHMIANVTAVVSKRSTWRSDSATPARPARSASGCRRSSC